MKLPSIASLVTHATATITRFPAAITAAVVGSIFSMMYCHLDYNIQEKHFWYVNIIMSSYLAMLLSVAITVFAERNVFAASKKHLLQLAGVAASASYYFSLPNSFMPVSTIRFILFALGLHWLIAFAPFFSKGQMNAFWQYNKIIFLRILTSFLYTAVLFIGLALALLAVENLFKLHITDKLYFDLWVVLTGIFNTWFFLAGFPSDYTSLEQNDDYPKGLKIFTQFVLLPIITIYLLILYAYMSKILFTMQWPVGWVSYLVLGFSVAGILSLLLIHPIRFLASNKWILTFSRFFYFAIFPLLILLFLAIQRRISDYGITELRYFVLVLALWLLFTALYFLASKQKNIKIIPQSLCILAFLTAAGPWGAFSVSLRSQENHLVSLLAKNNLLVNGKIIKATNQPSFKDRKQISSIMSYLIEKHSYKILQPYYSQNLDSVMKKDDERYTRGQSEKLMSLINLRYVADYQQEEAASEYKAGFSYSMESPGVLDVKGVDYVIKEYTYNNYDGTKQQPDTSSYQLGNDSATVFFNPKTNQITIKTRQKLVASFDMDALLKKLRADTSIHEDDYATEAEMTQTANGSHIIVTSIGGKEDKKQLSVTSFIATLFIKE